MKIYVIDVDEGTARRDHRQAQEYNVRQVTGNEVLSYALWQQQKGKMCSDKPTAQKLIWSWKDQCGSVIEDDIYPSMSCKEIVSSGERILTGEGMWIINRLKPTCQDSKIYLQDLQTNWTGSAVLLYFMLRKIEAFLLLLLLVTIQKVSEVEICAKQTEKKYTGR